MKTAILFPAILIICPSLLSAQYMYRGKKDISNLYISGSAGGGTHFEGNDSDSDFSYGAEFAVRPSPKTDAGFSFSDLRFNLSGNAKYHDYFYMFFFNYHLEEARKGFYAGAQFGLVRRSIDASGFDYYLDTFGGGFRTGYEYPVSDDVSLNLDLRFLFTGSTKKTILLNNYELEVSADGANFIQYFLTLKYYF